MTTLADLINRNRGTLTWWQLEAATGGRVPAKVWALHASPYFRPEQRFMPSRERMHLIALALNVSESEVIDACAAFVRGEPDEWFQEQADTNVSEHVAATLRIIEDDFDGPPIA